MYMCIFNTRLCMRSTHVCFFKGAIFVDEFKIFSLYAQFCVSMFKHEDDKTWNKSSLRYKKDDNLFVPFNPNHSKRLFAKILSVYLSFVSSFLASRRKGNDSPTIIYNKDKW